MSSNTMSVIPLVPGAHIPSRPMFRYSPAELAEMTSQVNILLQAGLIQKSTSPFGAPVLFVKKNNGNSGFVWTIGHLMKCLYPTGTLYPIPLFYTIRMLFYTIRKTKKQKKTNP
jgi:hypothetical protein